MRELLQRRNRSLVAASTSPVLICMTATSSGAIRARSLSAPSGLCHPLDIEVIVFDLTGPVARHRLHVADHMQKARSLAVAAVDIGQDCIDLRAIEFVMRAQLFIWASSSIAISV